MFLHVVPLDALDIGLQFHLVPQAEVLHHVTGIAVQFSLFGEHLCPAVGGERQRIERRGHVDRGARVGVLAPGAAEEIPPFQQAKVGDAGLEQIDRRALAAETAADDQHLKGLHGPPVQHRESTLTFMYSRFCRRNDFAGDGSSIRQAVMAI
ncbi:hypothetical protein D3C84_947270 [compost metagenome]